MFAMHLPTMTAHDFHDKCTLMWVCCAYDGINGFDNTMQCRISADGHVGATEIVIDRSDHAGNVKNAELEALIICDAFVLQQFVQQIAPF